MGEKLRVNREADALIVVDVQRDFCAGGALPVPDGDEVVSVLNQWLRKAHVLKVATRDWHPANHCSFREQGGPWPPHCVQGTAGAELHARLAAKRLDAIVSGATDPSAEAYSGFQGTDLLQILRDNDIARLWIGGLATEYCVRATVMDALQHGFSVFVIEDAIRGIEAHPGDVAEACLEMENAGAHFVESDEVKKK